MNNGMQGFDSAIKQRFHGGDIFNGAMGDVGISEALSRSS